MRIHRRTRMKPCPSVCAVLFGFACIEHSFAQEMRWFWSHSAPVPERVRPGNVVQIHLWAEWNTPFHSREFAASTFSIHDLAGGQVLFSGKVEFQAPFGLNSLLRDYLPDDGTPHDSDADGALDSIDGIFAFQLPCFFMPCEPWHPLEVYRIRWTAGSTPGAVSLVRGATADGVLRQSVYLDPFGTNEHLHSVDAVLHLNVTDCVADWNGDGTPDGADVTAYLHDYQQVRMSSPPFLGDPNLAYPADLDTADILAFLEAFARGC